MSFCGQVVDFDLTAFVRSCRWIFHHELVLASVAMNLGEAPVTLSFVRASFMQIRNGSKRWAGGLRESPKRGRLVIAACLALLVVACGRNEPVVRANPVGPTAPSAPTVPTLTLSGVVSEGGQPIENAFVQVYGAQSCSSGCSSREFNGGSGTTDAAGRYSIVVRRPEEAAAAVWALARKTGYVQQCVASSTMQADASLDVRLTSLANLAAARPQAGPGSRTISGAVFESTATGRPPVEGASVGWEGLLDSVLAETRSDAAGHYLLCGLPVGQFPGLFAQKQGYGPVSYVTVSSGSDTNVDIEIARR